MMLEKPERPSRRARARRNLKGLEEHKASTHCPTLAAALTSVMQTGGIASDALGVRWVAQHRAGVQRRSY